MTEDTSVGSDRDSLEPPLFDAFPDPLLVYGSERAGGSDSSPDSLVLRAANPAFVSTFDVEPDRVGAPLDHVAIAGRIASDTDDADVDDSSSDDTTTVRAILDVVRGTADSTLRLTQDHPGDSRHFHVRAIDVRANDAESDDVDGCLCFTEVSDLERRRRELVARVDRLERIADVVSHDIRNPLEVASIRLEAAQETNEAVHFEKVAGALARIEQLVSDVLSVGAGRVDPTDTVALGDAAESAWATVDTAEATLVIDPKAPTIRADIDRLRQVFENLFRNAVEHAGRDATVTVELLPDGFAVVDDGPGIPPEIGERVFEIGVSTTPGSRGLGLSIVDRIAREHGWQVSVASPDSGSADSDAGARFEFTGVTLVD
ncbi:HAMP domain-containing sensor histidine kinase [Salinigranum marinum]|uniref:sensor histidine kinase n=1 Tax=Salinigranum marinum TaxID=1515595 RepID=UPI002989E26E|nr:HAMP domain-containing sensor histidine kinase [Salinigranum marinum]